MDFDLVAHGTATSGYYIRDNNLSITSGTGLFLGETAAVVTKAGTMTVSRTVGSIISLNIELYLYSYIFGLDGSSAYALTIGVQSMTTGASLEWNGVPWIGTLEDSEPLLPPIPPLPAPGPMALALAMAASAIRRGR